MLEALWPIGEIMDTGRRSNSRPLLVIIGAGLSTCQIKKGGQLLMKLK